MPRLPALAAALALSAGASVHAVIVLGPQGRNTSAPTGDLADAGWQYQGRWGSFLGTPVGPDSFLTARHVGGGVGGSLTYGGVAYPTVKATDVPGTDLRLFTIAGTFPTFAPVWDAAVDGSEVGRPLFVVGRGTQRGAAFTLPTTFNPDAIARPLSGAGPVSPTPTAIAPTRDAPPITPTGPTPVAPTELRGWLHGGGDGVQTWGTNVVDSIADGGDRLGPLLAFSFDKGTPGPAGSATEYAVDPNEAALSGFDSGGGVFVLSPSGVWKLAGINYGIDGPFSTTVDGPAFFASIFDARGLWFDPDGSGPDPRELLEGPGPIVAGSYATPVSAHLDVLRPLIGPATVPEPATVALVAGVGLFLLRRRVGGE